MSSTQNPSIASGFRTAVEEMRMSDLGTRLFLLAGLVDALVIIGFGIAVWYSTADPFSAGARMYDPGTMPAALSPSQWLAGVFVGIVGQSLCLGIGAFAIWTALTHIRNALGRSAIFLSALVLQIEGLACWLPLIRAVQGV